MNKLVQRETFIDTARVKGAEFKGKSGEGPQIVMLRVEWFGRLKWCGKVVSLSVLIHFPFLCCCYFITIGTKSTV